MTAPVLPGKTLAAIRSRRTSERTRTILFDRLAKSSLALPQVPFDERQLATLRAVLQRVVPQEPAHVIELLPAVLDMLAGPVDDGWRFARLPHDVEAWKTGLAILERTAVSTFVVSFADLDATRQDKLLTALDADIDTRCWFEDVRGMVVRAWVSHPLTMSRIGYDGFANGGDGADFTGFHPLAPSKAEGPAT